MTHFFPNKTAWQFCQEQIDEFVRRYDLAWGNVMSLDPVNQRLIFIASSGNTAQDIRRRVIDCSANLAGLAVEEREPWWIDDLRVPRDDGRTFYHTYLIDKLGLSRLCSIPILNSFNNHQILLVMNLYPKKLDEKSEEAAKKRLSKQWKDDVRQFGECFERCLEEGCLRAVNRLNATISTGHQQDRPTLKTICRTFARIACEKIGCDTVAIFTQPPQREVLELQAWAEDIEPLKDQFAGIENLVQKVYKRNREELHLFEDKVPGWQLPTIKNQKQVSALLVPIRTPGGAPLGVVMAANYAEINESAPAPLTYEHVAIIESMAQAFVPRIELMYSEERKTMAMSRLAHEMRVPVSAFRAAIERIEGEMHARKWVFQRDYMSDLNSYARIMQWNVRELDLVRGAIDRLQLMVGPTYLESDVIQPATRHVEAECRRRNFNSKEIKVSTFRDHIPQLHVDRDLMTHVVFNLLENAIKYAHPEPERFFVKITPHWRANGEYEIRFNDNGRGVPAGFEEKIFQESYRHIDAWGIPGDGLGLFVARQLVQVHGGTLECTPRDRGAEFVIRLPGRLRYHPPMKSGQ